MTTKKKWKKSSPDLIDRFQTVMQGFDGIEMRKMFGYPCSFVNNNMFTGLHEENWVVRLSEKDHQKACQSLGVKAFEPMQGRVMREYICLTPKHSADLDLMNHWIQRSLNYVGALPPKQPKKR